MKDVELNKQNYLMFYFIIAFENYNINKLKEELI